MPRTRPDLSRRSVARFFGDSSLAFILNVTLGMQERLALDHGEDQGREPIVLADELGNDVVDMTAIGLFEPATKSVGQQLLGQAPGKRVATRQ